MIKKVINLVWENEVAKSNPPETLMGDASDINLVWSKIHRSQKTWPQK